MKNGDRVSVKLTLPQDLPWKILGNLLRDLGTSPSEDAFVYTSNCYRSYYDRFEKVIRKRNPELLLELCSELDARRIIELTGTDESKSFAFYHLYQLSSLLKKFPFKGLDTKTPALKKFKELEQHCMLYNTENYKTVLSLNSKHPYYLGIIEEIREDIRRLIGDCPNIDSVLGHAKHGPGVSLGDFYKKGKTTNFFKFSSLPYTVTKGTLPYAKLCITSDQRWIGALDDWYRRTYLNNNFLCPIDLEDFWDKVFKIVTHNKITTVPKTAIIDRTIAVEPVMNVFIQLGVDHILKTLLRRWGYDLSSQELNQELAKEASLTNLLVTLDLKGASDTVTLKACELLLPELWYNLLLDLRSPEGDLDGEIITYEKISSMGNGCTFALESLIFAALVRCALRRTKSEKKSAVFGDDLIVPVTASSYLQDLLGLFGFMINVEKSFSNGPFRESCGCDFYLGELVRPLFLTDVVRDVTDLFYVYNSFLCLRDKLPWTFGIDFMHTLTYIHKLIPKHYRENFCGPKSENLDTHLFSDVPLRRNKYRQRVYYRITPIPIGYNCRSKSFFFRKLMVSLRDKPVQPFWKKRSKDKVGRGNAFDVVKSGYVQYICTRATIP